jgi:hypothetical protein
VTGHGNTATLLNGATFAAGRTGTALSLDGTNDYVSVPNSSTLDISGSALTLETWLYPTAITGDRVVLGKFWNTTMTSPYYQYGIELAGGAPTFCVGTAGGLVGAGMGSALPPKQWSHLAIVCSGTKVQFYVGGALVSAKTMSATLTARGNQLRLGADNNTQQFFKGLMDDVRIYKPHAYHRGGTGRHERGPVTQPLTGAVHSGQYGGTCACRVDGCFVDGRG